MRDRAEDVQCDQEPTVSAIIPAYNAAETIERALNSVYAQTYPNIIEVIVVDDGSTDATAQIVREKFPEVVLIQQRNAGVSVARNAGVDAASGELIAFLDADDEWLPEKTDVHVTVMKDHPGVVLCISDSAIPGSADATRPLPGPLLEHMTFRDTIMRSKTKRWGCTHWLVRRAVIARHRFDPRLRRHQDIELIRRLAGLGYGVAFYNRPLSIYYPPTTERLRRQEISAASAGWKLLLGEQGAGIGSSAACRWLTDRERHSISLRQHRIAADVLCLSGDDTAAMELARQALREDGGHRVDRWRLWAIARAPRAYGAIRRRVMQLMGS